MTTEQSEKPALEYEHASARFATRRQFRWLLALLLLNLLITLQTAYWPGLVGSFKSHWSDYQQHRRQRAARQQVMALTQPPSHIVWDENPETAAALLAATGYKPIRVESLERYPFLSNWPRGAAANIPPAADSFYRDQFNPTYHHAFPNLGGQRVVEPDESALILMHAFRTPAGEDRLVYVYVQGKLNLNRTSLPAAQTGPRPDRVPIESPFSATVHKELSIIAVPCRLPAPGEDALPTPLFDERTTLVIHPDSDPREVRWTWTPPAAGQPEQIRLLDGGHLRLFAGQPDPADPTHFTIRYDFDGRPGTIHGHLKPTGTVDLHPDHGTLVGTRWDPTAP